MIGVVGYSDGSTSPPTVTVGQTPVVVAYEGGTIPVVNPPSSPVVVSVETPLPIQIDSVDAAIAGIRTHLAALDDSTIAVEAAEAATNTAAAALAATVASNSAAAAAAVARQGLGLWCI